MHSDAAQTGTPQESKISHLVTLWLHPAQGDGELPGSERSALLFFFLSSFSLFVGVAVKSAKVQSLGQFTS